MPAKTVKPKKPITGVQLQPKAFPDDDDVIVVRDGRLYFFCRRCRQLHSCEIVIRPNQPEKAKQSYSFEGNYKSRKIRNIPGKVNQVYAFGEDDVYKNPNLHSCMTFKYNPRRCIVKIDPKNILYFDSVGKFVPFSEWGIFKKQFEKKSL
jgi:hypothetical protein